MVPTVERGLRLVVFCSIEIAGLKPVDRIDLGPLHLIQKLARVGRKRFDVAALALGVNRVEGERRLARSAQPGDHREGVARNLDVDILQVVLPCPVHGDAVQQVAHCPIRLLAARESLQIELEL